MKTTSVILILLFLFSCKKETFDIVNLNGNKISVLGHAGMGINHTYPINSYESVLNCLTLGADGTELDIQMTKDSVVILFHDEYLESSTNSSGQVFSKTWAEIKSSSYTDPLYANYKIISLDELLSNIPNVQQYTFAFDCKNYDSNSSNVNTFNQKLIQLIEKHQLENTVNLEYNRVDMIASMKTLSPNLRIFAYTTFDEAMNIVNQYQIDGISISTDLITKEQVLQAHNNGTLVSVFGTDAKAGNIEAIEKNVDFIQTDKLKHLIKVIK